MKKLAQSLIVVLALFFGARAVQAELPDGLTFDDGFTWIECHQFDTTENNVLKSFWVPEFSFRIWGKMPANPGYKLVLRQADKKIYEVKGDCFPFNMGPYSGCNILGAWRDNTRLTASGIIFADFYYIDGNTNKETLAKTCKIDVRKAPTNRGGVGSREPGYTNYYVNRHGEILSNILYFRDVEFPSYTGYKGVSYFTERRVELILNYSETANIDSPKLGRIVVEVDGKVIDMMVPGHTMPSDQIGFGEGAGKYNVEHSDRDAEKYFKAGPPYRERIGFQRRSMTLPFEWGPKWTDRAQGFPFTTTNPGSYKITWLIDREPVRIFRFKVDANGMGIPHEEQKLGLNLAPGAILVETEIPTGGAHFDGRLTSTFVKEGGFFGRPWATASMKALAAAVPTKGKPFPESSGKKG